MDEENNREDDYSEFPETFDDTFEIGIPVEETINLLKIADGPGVEPDVETDVEPNVETADASGTEAERESETNGEPDGGDVEAFTEPDLSDENAAGIATSPFEDIKTELRNLSSAFETKLKYDAHKNKIIDDLHQSLQDYREGLVKKYIHRVVMDIIKVVDDIRKFTAHHRSQPASDETYEKLLNYTETIASDLEDLFSWEGIMPFACEGDAIDLARQRILQRIATDDPEKDKTVAERLRPGYEWDGKIIRPEMISAFIYETESAPEDNNKK